MAEKSNPSEEYLGEEYFREEPVSENWFKRFIMGPYWVIPAIIFVAISAFSLGRVYNIEKVREPVKIIESNKETVENRQEKQAQEKPAQTANVIQAQTLNTSGQVVGSKNSTKYHYPWCSGAKRISKENLVTFASTEEARAKGYTPASNCPGLK